MRLPTFNPRYPKTMMAAVVGGTYYALSTWQIYQKDQFEALLEWQDAQHQIYLDSDRGKADRLAHMEMEAESTAKARAWEKEEERKLSETPEGRAKLEKNKAIMISDLRYRETKLQYLLARQQPDLKKAENNVREKLYTEALRRQAMSS